VYQRALDPSLAPLDSIWASALRSLAALLLRNGASDEAQAWLRWGVREAPALVVAVGDSPPDVAAALQTARAFVSADQPNPRSQLEYRWSTDSGGGFGELRLNAVPGDAGRELEATINGVGRLNGGRPRRLAAGSYRITARGTDRAGADFASNVTTEVLPGVATVVTISLTPPGNVIAAATERRVFAQLARVDASTGAGGASACAVGVVAGGQGLLLTSYRSIRGASGISLQLPEGSVPSDRVRVAAYDVSADLAVLTTGTPRSDSLLLAAASPATGASVWAIRFADCGASPGLARVTVTDSSRNSFTLGAGLTPTDVGTALVTNTGAVAGLLTAPTSARTTATAAALLFSARRNLSAGQLLTASSVALREKHAFGEVTLQSSQAGTRVRISPLESWQWADVARVETLPFTFRGPMGRYSVAVLNGDQVTKRSEIVVDPSATKQGAVGGKKGRSKLLPIFAGLALGGGAAALLGSKRPVKPTTGEITIQLP
jgi:hypothetical protein